VKHLLSIEALSRDEILEILDVTAEMKATRGRHAAHPLRHQCWAIIFSKSSTRTRVSFEVGIRELGGDVMFLSANDIQLGRGEPIKDTARVMGRMLHGAVIRTFAQKDVEDFAQYSGIPTINALTDEEHPCQILADLFTIREKRGSLDDLKVCFIGDGECNMPRSWIWAAAKLGIELRIAAPPQFQPPADLLARASGNISVTTDLKAAAAGADVLYTDVWISRGKPPTASPSSAATKSTTNSWPRPNPARSSCIVFPPTAVRKSPTKHSRPTLTRFSSRRRTVFTPRKRS
jgi:ornithine carbamoyltransferase